MQQALANHHLEALHRGGWSQGGDGNSFMATAGSRFSVSVAHTGHNNVSTRHRASSGISVDITKSRRDSQMSASDNQAEIDMPSPNISPGVAMPNAGDRNTIGFFDLIASLQSQRLDDQRSPAPKLPGGCD